MKFSLVILTALIFTACGHTTKQPAELPAAEAINVGETHDVVAETPVFIDPTIGIHYQAAWDGKVSDTWTPMLVEILKNHGLPMFETKVKDAAKYCPKLNELPYEKKMQFYVGLISKMAQYESNFKPETKYTESFKDSKGKYVISRGLLQMSVESSNQSAYGCGVTETTLHDVRTNLTCAVKVANHWITKDKYVGTSLDKSTHRGVGRYWSVGRASSGSNPKIAAYTKSLDVCK